MGKDEGVDVSKDKGVGVGEFMSEVRVGPGAAGWIAQASRLRGWQQVTVVGPITGSWSSGGR